MPNTYTDDQLVEEPAVGLSAELGWRVTGPIATARVADGLYDAGLLGRETESEASNAPLVVSSGTFQSDGRHWLHRVGKAGDKQHSRLAYVASPRRDRLPAWAIPEPDAEHKTMPQELGLIPAN